MKIKSYFARTVEDAMAMASQELGPEAMLLNSRKALPESRHLGEYEVVFANGFEAGDGGASSADSAAGNGVAFASPPVSDRLSRDVAELKKELENMRRSLTRSALT